MQSRWSGVSRVALGPCGTYGGGLDASALASPWGVVASAGCGASLEPLLAAIQSVAPAGVELIDPVVSGDWSSLSERPGGVPSASLGVLWGLAMAERRP